MNNVRQSRVRSGAGRVEILGSRGRTVRVDIWKWWKWVYCWIFRASEARSRFWERGPNPFVFVSVCVCIYHVFLVSSRLSISQPIWTNFYFSGRYRTCKYSKKMVWVRTWAPPVTYFVTVPLFDVIASNFFDARRPISLTRGVQFLWRAASDKSDARRPINWTQRVKEILFDAVDPKYYVYWC